MINGKNKFVTFSYDDGVTQDIKLIEIFNKYNLKATFNLNSELLGVNSSLIIDGKTINHTKNEAKEVKKIYQSHEVAVHTLTHPNLTEQSDDEIVRQIVEDQNNLHRLTGSHIVGMAYPCGGINNNEHVAGIIRNCTSIKYARTIISSYKFDMQENLLQFNPTVYHLETKKMHELVRQFIDLKISTPSLLYIWGHSYEFDINNTWEDFKDICKDISGRNDIFYGTNNQVFQSYL